MRVRKVCMIGDFGVGKTSLVARFVHSIFSEKYLTTVGVKIDTRILTPAGGEPIKLIIWDIAGTSALSSIEQQYLKGAAAYLLVADGTRGGTLETALQLDRHAQALLDGVPRILLLNKLDLREQWEVEQQDLSPLGSPDRPLLLCSALSGAGVEEAFSRLAQMVSGD